MVVIALGVIAVVSFSGVTFAAVVISKPIISTISSAPITPASTLYVESIASTSTSPTPTGAPGMPTATLRTCYIVITKGTFGENSSISCD